MIIYLGFYKRRPDLTHEQFCRHWSECHGPLLRDTPEIARHLRRYIQHHLSPNTAWPGLQPLEFDGFSEAWFDSVEHRKRMYAEPLFQKLCPPDEEKFLDLSATRVSMFDTQVVQVGFDIASVFSLMNR